MGVKPLVTYAGKTPLNSTLVFEQTGPMELSTPGGEFTSTGSATIMFVDGPTEQKRLVQILAGEAARLRDLMFNPSATQAQMDETSAALIRAQEALAAAKDTAAKLQPFIASGAIDVLPNGDEVRQYHQDKQGNFMRPETYKIAAQKLTFESDPDHPRLYTVTLVKGPDGAHDLWKHSYLLDRFEVDSPPPAGYVPDPYYPDIIKSFAVPAGATSLDEVEILYQATAPGFAPGTTLENGQLVQRGTA